MAILIVCAQNLILVKSSRPLHYSLCETHPESWPNIDPNVEVRLSRYIRSHLFGECLGSSRIHIYRFGDRVAALLDLHHHPKSLLYIEDSP